MKNEENKVIIKFIVTLVIVLALCIGIYFLTKYVVNKDTDTNTETSETKDVSINYESAIIGTMLNKKDNEYYVILYNKSKDDAYKYTQLVTNYKALKDSLPIYIVDLSTPMNSPYYTSEATNPKAENLSELKFGDITVIKVKNGKITNAYETIDSIKTLWKLD